LDCGARLSPRRRKFARYSIARPSLPCISEPVNDRPHHHAPRPVADSDSFGAAHNLTNQRAQRSHSVRRRVPLLSKGVLERVLVFQDKAGEAGPLIRGGAYDNLGSKRAGLDVPQQWTYLRLKPNRGARGRALPEVIRGMMALVAAPGMGCRQGFENSAYPLAALAPDRVPKVISRATAVSGDETGSGPWSLARSPL